MQYLSVLCVLKTRMLTLSRLCRHAKVIWVEEDLFIHHIHNYSEICALHLTHPRAHTHLKQWTANAAVPGEQLGVRCLAQGSHLSRGIAGGESTSLIHSPHRQFLPEPRFEPTTSGYKSDALSLGHDCPEWMAKDSFLNQRRVTESFISFPSLLLFLVIHWKLRAWIFLKYEIIQASSRLKKLVLLRNCSFIDHKA